MIAIRQSYLVMTALTSCALAMGCAGKKSSDARAPTTSSTAIENTNDKPVIPGADDGLEVRSWVTDDRFGQVGRALAKLSADVNASSTDDTMSAELRARWEANGLRWTRLPAAALSDLERQLPAIKMRQASWIGWTTRWSEIFRGGSEPGVHRVSAPLIVSDDGQQQSAAQGSSRFIARTWTAPHASESSELAWRLRLELAVQTTRVEPPNSDLLKRPLSLGAERDGTVYERLTLETALEAGWVYVVTAEQPGIVWTVEPAAEPEQGDQTLGPQLPRPLTIGESMMTSMRATQAGERAKALLVLVPRVPTP